MKDTEMKDHLVFYGGGGTNILYAEVDEIIK